MSSARRDAVELQMRLRGLAAKTHEAYIHAMEQLARRYWRPLDALSCEDVQAFLDELISKRKLAWATVNVHFSAYRFLYESVLKWPSRQFSIPPRGRSGTRPGVLSRDEVKRLIGAPRSVKHQAILSMTYGSGLRVSEVVRIRLCDISRERMMMRVEQGKGRKDRYTILSRDALYLAGEAWKRERSPEWLFAGRPSSRHISAGTVQQVYYNALESSGVRRVGGIHVLRHCFATHLMETGVDIYTIRRWMGHTSLKTTGRYMHVTEEHLRKVVSPLDMLEPDSA